MLLKDVTHKNDIPALLAIINSNEYDILIFKKNVPNYGFTYGIITPIYLHRFDLNTDQRGGIILMYVRSNLYPHEIQMNIPFNFEAL